MNCLCPKTKILLVGAGPFALKSRIKNDKLFYLSQNFACSYITPLFQAEHYEIKKNIGIDKIIVDGVKIYSYPYYLGNSLLRNFISGFHIISKALKINYKENMKYKVIISTNPLFIGLIVIIVGAITGAKTIIEVNGNFEDAFKYGYTYDTKLKTFEKMKEKISRLIITIVVKRADMVRLLYDKQLLPLGLSERKFPNIISFSDFVPVEQFVKSKKSDNKYILLLGFPWYLKGVDILIKAFKKIHIYIPEYRLKIVGWCPEGREYYENLAKGNSNIDLCNPVNYKEVIPLMAKCSLYVLASRTEAMGRVLIEAMACKKPIIACDVGGVSCIVKNGFNGLLFEKENVDDLAEKIKIVLSDQKLAFELAENGYQFVQAMLSEKCYVQNFRNMIEKVVKNN